LTFLPRFANNEQDLGLQVRNENKDNEETQWNLP
jgi:hypothetical protein